MAAVAAGFAFAMGARAALQRTRSSLTLCSSVESQSSPLQLLRAARTRSPTTLVERSVWLSLLSIL